MALTPFNAGSDVAQKTEHWKQDQIDAVERAKEQQREREANQQRDADSHGHQAENPQ
jgi:hypothetical protein